jgi:hypothetical protein
MKTTSFALVLTVAALAALSACGTRQPRQPVTDSAAPPGAVFLGIRAFEAVCLKTAPSFAGAADAAKSFGIARVDDAGIGGMGMTTENSLGVQIKPGVECAITTPSQADRTLSSQFGAAIAQASGGRAPARFPVAIVVSAQPFIFHHDRQGGEAFVMLKTGPATRQRRKVI